MRIPVMHPVLSSNSALPLTLTTLVSAAMLSSNCFAQQGKPDQQSGYATSRFAGTGTPPRNRAAYRAGEPRGDANSVPLGNPFGVEVLVPPSPSIDPDGGRRAERVWITTVEDHCVWQVTAATGKIQRVAGNGTSGYSGDGGPATEAQFNWPHEVRRASGGDLFIADTRNHVIRKVDADTGIVSTIAGNGRPGYAGDGRSGAEVQFQQPHSVVLDGTGGLLVADTRNHRLRRIDLDSGIVETISGTGEPALPVEGSLASEAPLFGPRSLAVDADSIWIALREGNSIWRIDRKTDRLHRVAGTGAKGYSGDGGPPLQARFNGPKGLAIDSEGNILVVDTENHVIRRIDLEANLVETVLGGAEADDRERLKRPHGIAPLPVSGFLVGDSENHRVLAAP